MRRIIAAPAGLNAAPDPHLHGLHGPTRFRELRTLCLCLKVNWDPTPIPHLPMQFNFNLWHSRSRELAGKLSLADLPATAELRALHVYSRHDEQNVEAGTGPAASP